MAFINDMKEKFSHAGQSAVQKTKDFTEVNRLNNEIDEAGKQITDLYGRIGCEIYHAYKDKPLPEVAQMIEQVAALQQKIESNKKQIYTINTANLCPHCGAKVSREMAFCRACGNKLQAQPPAQASGITCGKCGASCAEGAIFCMTCGNKLEE